MRQLLAALLWLLGTALAAADDYRLLRREAAGFAAVTPGRAIGFPADHLPHTRYRIEWWYLTANLVDRQGRDYGLQWTLFRQSLDPAEDPGGWSSNQAWMAHAALSTPERHRYVERFARGGIGQAGVRIDAAGRFEARMDDWLLLGHGPAPLPGTLRFTVGGADVALELAVDSPWVLQGEQGYSRKSERGQASYYYSQPHIRASGTLTLEDRTVEVSGAAWLDREWSSQPLAPDQPGWDWLSLHLEDGHALMVYRLRQSDGRHWLQGTWIDPAGAATPLGPDQLRFEPLRRTAVETGPGERRELPLHWRVALPGRGLSWTIAPSSAEHWLDVAFPYWEGPVTAAGSTAGRGYLELTGY